MNTMMLAMMLATSDGVRISVDWYHTDGHQAAVIVCPGFFQSKDTATFRAISRALAKEHDVLAMDFRGHGRSSGLYTFSAREHADLAAVLAWARPRYRRLAIVGFSMGAAIAVNTVSRDPAQIQSLVLVSAPAAFHDIEFQFWTPEAIRTGLRGMEWGAGCRPGSLWLAKERPVDHIATLSPRPVLLLHGTNDPIVSFHHSERLFRAAAHPKRLELIPRGGHAEELYRQDPSGFIKQVSGWLTQTMPDQ